ncbi:acetyltransferase [Vibrio cholerae]|nr:acetyltransferase [Vibrio cholerae]EGR2590901.1 acetyltransferase [Vibrio cholerae]RNE84560.1 acetyltransferase [Vibrio cholerae]
MVTVAVFEFSVMRCQPLRRALCAWRINEIISPNGSAFFKRRFCAG